MQRWNNDEDSTARNNWNAEAKDNQQLKKNAYMQIEQEYLDKYFSYFFAKIYFIHQKCLNWVPTA